jgi:hypothetical protein
VCEHVKGTAHEPLVVLAVGDAVYVYAAFDPNIDDLHAVLDEPPHRKPAT